MHPTQGPLEFAFGWINAGATAPSGPDVYERNDSLATATVITDSNATLSRTAGLATLAPGEGDWYRFDAQEGAFTASLINNAATADVELQWYNENGDLVRGAYGNAVQESLFLNRGIERDQPVYLFACNSGPAAGVYDIAWDFRQR